MTTDEKCRIYNIAFNLFITKPIPQDILKNYLVNSEYSIVVQDWVVNHLKPELLSWCTGIGIMDSVDLLYNEAISNGNIKL